MSAREKIIELAGAGLSAAGIAAHVGVSRQRVYQVLKTAVVMPPRPFFGRERAAERYPKPRLITGGVEVALTTNSVGTISELLVAADLLARGWAPYLPVMRSKYHDILASHGAVIASFEVRSGKRYPSGTVSYARDKVKRSNHYAVVIEGEPVVYDPPLSD